MTVNFSDVRSTLRFIGETVGAGHVVSCSWNGTTLKVAVHQPNSGRQAWVMTFDDEADYLIDPKQLVADLAGGARTWFSDDKEEMGAGSR